MRRKIKSLLGRVIFFAGLHRVALRSRAVVVLFHRVDDSFAGDPISCTSAEFRAYCDFFRRHFVVVSLSELVAKLRAGRDISRHLVITFDDGYRDNWETAAAELRERGLPACFFVASGFIGTDRVGWWDAANGVRSRWMTWDQVRLLRESGFEVGAHTVNHPDLGCVDRDEAEREVVESRSRLEAELGIPVQHFAYPFGGRINIKEENREVVRSAGFASCLSAYGGLVTHGTDPMSMQRVPTSNWALCPYQFGFELLQDEYLTNGDSYRDAHTIAADPTGPTSGLQDPLGVR